MTTSEKVRLPAALKKRAVERQREARMRGVKKSLFCHAAEIYAEEELLKPMNLLRQSPPPMKKSKKKDWEFNLR